jgi:hypothetical protein
MANSNGRVANLDERLAEFMERVWAGFRQAGSRRAIDRRTQRGILAYVEGLRTDSDEPKTFKGLARILEATPGTSSTSAEQLQRLITDRDWDGDAVLEAAAIVLAPRLISEALVLRNVNTTRLGGHRYRAVDRVHQRALLLALAARIPDGDVTLLILRWRLAIELNLWGRRANDSHPNGRGDPYSRFKVPAGAEKLSIPLMGAKAVADARHWPELDLPVVGGATFSGIRRRWLRAEVPYIVEWIPPATASLDLLLNEASGVTSVKPLNVKGTALREMYLVTYKHGREAIFRKSAPKGHRSERANRTWCTNMLQGRHGTRSLSRAMELGELRFTLQPTYQELRARYGLNDYRGISYTGWHRHAALVALAHSAEIYAKTKD